MRHSLPTAVRGRQTCHSIAAVNLVPAHRGVGAGALAVAQGMAEQAGGVPTVCALQEYHQR